MNLETYKQDDKARKARIEELREKISEKKREYDYHNAMQLAFKLVLNGSYGAFANKHFVCSNADIANAITAHGRDVIQYMNTRIEDYFYNKWHLDVDTHRLLGVEGKVSPIDPNPTWGMVDGINVYTGPKPCTIYNDTDSCYLSYTPILESMGHVEVSVEDTRKLVLEIDSKFVKGLFRGFLEDYARPYGVKNIHDFELETISRSSLFLEKKNYLNNIVWEDGVPYKDMSYFYPKGIEIVRSTTPAFVRENIYEVIRYIFTNPKNVNIHEVLRIVKKMRREYEMADIDDISMTSACSNYDRQVINDTTGVECAKGTHFGVKASALHNYLLNKNSEYKTRYDLIKSGRVKYYYCKHPMADVFAYVRGQHPTEITQKEGVVFDTDVMFEKCCLAIINKLMKPLGLPVINKRISVLSSLFSF